MQLIRPIFPDPVGSASYFSIQAMHRATAINHGLAAIEADGQRDLQLMSDDTLMADLGRTVVEWAMETLLQGAWIREFHEWEKATKAFFDGQHERNGSPRPSWRGKRQNGSPASHVDRVRDQLEIFNAIVSDGVVEKLDHHRQRVNEAKHNSEIFIEREFYDDLVTAVGAFWDSLDQQEAFNIGRGRKAPGFP